MSTVSNTTKGTALVTGASAGLGSIFAARLAARGYNLTLVARRADRLTTLATQLQQQYGITVKTLAADLGTTEGQARIEAEINEDGALTLLVNNAGVSTLSHVTDISAENHAAMINVNVVALSRLSIAALRAFKARNHGTLINIGSVLGFHTLPVSAIYSGTKGYVVNFTRGLQTEVDGTNVSVQLVLPSATATDIWELSGVPMSALKSGTIMTAEHCVDAALTGLDLGEDITLPSVEQAQLWHDYDAARVKLFQATQNSQPASRYTR